MTNFTVESAKHTRREMDEAVEAVTQLPRLKGKGIVYTVRVDVETNETVVTFEPKNDKQWGGPIRNLARKHPSIRFETAPNLEGFLGARQLGNAPLYTPLSTANNTYNCTTGPNFRYLTGQLGSLTADHCLNNGGSQPNRFNSGTGPLATEVRLAPRDTYSDIGFLYNSSDTYPAAFRNQFAPANSEKAIIGTYFDYQIPVNQYLCKGGATAATYTTKERCGTYKGRTSRLVSGIQMFIPEFENLSQWVVAGGDSGSPVYIRGSSGNYIVSVTSHNASMTTSGCNPRDRCGYRGGYTAMDQINSYGDVLK